MSAKKDTTQTESIGLDFREEIRNEKVLEIVESTDSFSQNDDEGSEDNDLSSTRSSLGTSKEICNLDRKKTTMVVPIKRNKGKSCFISFLDELLKMFIFFSCGCCRFTRCCKRKIKDELEMLKITLMKILVLSFVVCRFQPLSFEVNSNEMIIHATNLLAHIAHFSVVVFFAAAYFYEGFKWTFVIPAVVSVVIVCITDSFFVCAFVFKLRRAFLGHIVAFLMNIVFVSSVVFATEMLKGSCLVIIFLLPPLLMIAVNDPKKVLWCFISLGVITCSTIYQITRTGIEFNTIEISPYVQIHVYLIQFVSNMITSIFVMFFQWFLYSKLTSFQTKVTKIGSAILKLNFEDTDIIDLMETPDKICSTQLLLLKRIVSNVKEYKTYLPQGLVLSSEEKGIIDESNQSQSNFHESSISSSSISTSEHESSNSASRKSVDSLEHEKKKNRKNRWKAERRRKQQLTTENLIDYSLQNRFGTYLLVDINGWNCLMEENGAQLYVSYYSRFVEIVEDVMKRTRGLIINMTNDKIVCGWNIKNVVVKHELQAVVASHDIIHLLKTDIRLPVRATCKISVVTGNSTVGNMGCSTIKSFNFFSRKINALFSLNNFCRVVKNEFVVLVDQRTREKIKYDFKTLFINCVKSRERKFRIYQVMERNKRKTDEWMYEIKDHLNKTPTDDTGGEEEMEDNEFNSTNDIFVLSEKLEESFISQDFDRAGKFLEIIVSQRERYSNIYTKNGIKKNIRKKRPYTII